MIPLLLAQAAAFGSDTTITVGLGISILTVAVAAGRQQMRIEHLDARDKERHAELVALRATQMAHGERMTTLEVVLGELRVMARDTRDDVRRISASGSYAAAKENKSA